MKVRLNLATSPLESNRRFTVATAAIGTVALLAFLILSRQAYTVSKSDRIFRTRQAALESQIAVLEQQRQSLAQYFNQPDTVKRRDRAAYLNGFIEQRAFPGSKSLLT